MGAGSYLILAFCFLGMVGIGGFIIYGIWRPSKRMQWEPPEKKNWSDHLYPASYYLHRIMREYFRIPFPDEKIKRLQMVQMGSTRQQLEECYDCQRLSGILLISFLTFLIVSFAVIAGNGKALLSDASYLIRAEPGGGEQQAQLRLEGGDLKKKVTVTIPERQYRPREVREKLDEAKEYVRAHYLGENKSCDRVTQPLLLMSRIPDSTVKIRWDLDSNGYINKDGTLNTEQIRHGTEVSVTAIVICGEEQERIPLEMILYPRKMSREENFWRQWQEQLEQKMEETSGDSILPLPAEVDGQDMSYREVENPVWIRLLLGGLAFCIAFPSLLDRQTEQGIRKREDQLQKEYPEIVERFMLLLGAGLTVRGAWYRITDDYRYRREHEKAAYHYLYEEMLITRCEMENGKSERMAYTDFGRRMSLLQYMKFSTLLVQNLKKGPDDLLRRMNLEAVDAMRVRREMARKLGEEAGTKLLIPMMMMLVVVFALIMAAAFQTI